MHEKIKVVDCRAELEKRDQDVPKFSTSLNLRRKLERVVTYEDYREEEAMKEALAWREYQAVRREKQFLIAKARMRAEVKLKLKLLSLFNINIYVS